MYFLEYQIKKSENFQHTTVKFSPKLWLLIFSPEPLRSVLLNLSLQLIMSIRFLCRTPNHEKNTSSCHGEDRKSYYRRLLTYAVKFEVIFTLVWSVSLRSIILVLAEDLIGEPRFDSALNISVVSKEANGEKTQWDFHCLNRPSLSFSFLLVVIHYYLSNSVIVVIQWFAFAFSLSFTLSFFLSPLVTRIWAFLLWFGCSFFFYSTLFGSLSFCAVHFHFSLSVWDAFGYKSLTEDFYTSLVL